VRAVVAEFSGASDPRRKSKTCQKK